jgi:hypothetical protein
MSSHAQINATADAYEQGKLGFITFVGGKRKVIPPVSW